MERVTGSYKRWAKRWVIIIAIVVVCACNIDSIAIARTLYASGAVRTAVVQQAAGQRLLQRRPMIKPGVRSKLGNVLEADRHPARLVSAQSARRCLGLAVEDSRPADLGRCGGTWRTLLVSPAGPGRNATQYRTSPDPGLLARLKLRPGTEILRSAGKPALAESAESADSPALARSGIGNGTCRVERADSTRMSLYRR